MKKFCMLIIAVAFFLLSKAQGVAINQDGAPVSDAAAMLEIKKGSRVKVKIRSLSVIDTSQLELSNGAGNIGTDIRMSFNREEGLLFSSNSDVASKNQDSILSMKFQLARTYFGFNIKNPLSHLHIHDPTNNLSSIRLTNVSAGRGVTLNANGVNASLVNIENGNLLFATGNLARGGFDNTGNFGIGVLTPSERLTITGNFRMLSTDKGIMLDAQDKPIITRSWDAFTSGIYSGVGRWGLFMEPGSVSIGMPNIPGARFQVAKFNANSTRESVLAVAENGKVTKPATGSVNLLPICMGIVLGNGVIVNGSGNFSLVKDIASSLTEITINGESYNASNYIVQATCVQNSTAKSFAMIEDPGTGKLRIWTYLDNGIPSNRDFNFVVYKMN